jgi:hypothetical protein
MTSPTFEVRGLNVSSFSWQANNGAQQFREALAPAKAMGVNTLIFDIALEQDSLTSSQVRLTKQNGDSNGYSYDGATLLPQMIREAHAMGFDVWVKPIVLIGGLASNGSETYQWSSIAPTSPAQWFASYQQRLLEIVSFIEPLNTEGLLLGNELMSMTREIAYRPDWISLINAVSSNFSGEIGYNASGLSQPLVMPDELSQLIFLDALDFIGISAYPRLYGDLSPTREQMMAGWFADYYGHDNLIQDIRKLIADNPNLDVYLTELGSPATDGGNVMVYDTLRNATSDPRYFVRDLAEQRLFFDVALEVLARELGSQIGGVFPYGWSAAKYFIEDTPSTAQIYTWSLEGKPATEVIAQWYLGQRSAVGTDLAGTGKADNLGTGFFDDVIRGGRGNDVLSGGQGFDTLWGDGLPPLTQSNIELLIQGSGALYQGIAPIVTIWVNGTKIGTIDVLETETYRAPDGQAWHGLDTYRFEVVAGTAITDLRIVEENWAGSAPSSHRDFYVDSISIDGTQLAGPWVMVMANGQVQSNARSIYADGYMQLDTSAYNATLTSAFSDDDSIDGGLGLDTAAYIGSHANYSLSKDTAGWNIHSTLDGTDTLTNIERLQFADKNIALDVTADGNAGKALEFIGMLAFNKVTDKAIVGEIISYFDQLPSMHDINQLAISAGLTRALAGGDSSNAALAQLVFRNVVGHEASAGDIDSLVSYMDGRNANMTQADFLTAIAGLELNQAAYWIGWASIHRG